MLDVGCADGYLGAQLTGRGCQVWGLDNDARSLELVPAGAYVDTAATNLDGTGELPWPDLKFDAVLCLDVLEHLSEPATALRVLVSSLDDAGTVVISLPNVANVSVRLALLAGRFQYRDSGILDRTHQHLYTFASAIELAHSAGLRVERVLSGSNRFGRLLNKNPLLGRLGRGLLAYNVVLLCRRDDPPQGDTSGHVGANVQEDIGVGRVDIYPDLAAGP